MKAYIDSDVILDVLLGRDAFLAESARILNLCETSKLTGCTTALAVANIYYILSRYDAKKAGKAIRTLREILQILPVSDNEIGRALDSGFRDFEDGVQNFTAERHGCNLIITRNRKDYACGKIKAITPKEYLLRVSRNA